MTSLCFLFPTIPAPRNVEHSHCSVEHFRASVEHMDRVRLDEVCFCGRGYWCGKACGKQAEALAKLAAAKVVRAEAVIEAEFEEVPKALPAPKKPKRQRGVRKVHVGLRLPEDLIQTIDGISERRGIGRSEVIRVILEKEIGK